MLNNTNYTTAIIQITQASNVKANWYYSARFWVAFGFAGFITNVLEAVLICYTRKHKTIFGMTLLSLCVGDFLSSFSFFIVGLTRLIEYDGPLFVYIIPNTKFAKIYQGGHGALFFCMGTSFFHITIIAVQRFFAVFWPFRYKSSFRYKHCLILLISVWVLFFAMGVIGYFYIHIIWYATYIMSITVSGLLILSYTAIVIKNHHADQKRIALVRGIERNQKLKRQRSTRKIIHVSIAVTVAFLICTFPHAIFYLFLQLEMTIYHTVNSVISTNPFLDSVIYFFFYRDRNIRKNGTASISRRRETAEHANNEVLRKQASKGFRTSAEERAASKARSQNDVELEENANSAIPKNHAETVV